MIKLRLIHTLILLLPLLYGCVQPLHNTAVSQDINSNVSESKSAVPDEKATKGDNADRKPARYAHNKPDTAYNRSKDSEINNTTISENNIDDNKSPEKKIQTVMDEALDFCQASQDFWQKGEPDNAIEALDQAYSLILSAETYDEPKLIRQKEDLRFMISKRILEIYASRHIVVNGKHNAIPLVMNKHIQAELALFSGKEKKFFIESYKRSGRYRPYIVRELKKAGLPLELSWVPLIESGFKVRALSRARALGLWQFIPSTGYKFGLKRDIYIDERMDPVKSTQAAIAYLKELHQIFGDWTTVLAAYNCGEGRVLRVIRKQNVNYLDNFWDLYEILPRETARYVPRFLATLHIINNMDKYGLDLTSISPPMEYETVIISKQIHLKDIAGKIGAQEKTLKELNPELRYKILPGNKYPLKVPVGKTAILLAKLDEMPVSSPPRRAFVKHRVRSGETLSTIARKHRTSMSKIARANNIHKRNYIVAGKILKIPLGKTIISRQIKYSKPKYKLAKNHVVKSGDSLWIIARQYGTTTKKIQSSNNLTSTKLYIGQVLNLPGRKAASSSGDYLATYKVKRGDSPFNIAKKHNMPLEKFLRINHLTPRSKIYPGQKLFIE
ncbi:MAG: LysM peptidoglycan-binding domain-containing protein [Thermodesulfobacteriota bacterium]|nr:LysM peptidoglycan-binding domain-containing protein [Thermodesulfobacteriota bacterium]